MHNYIALTIVSLKNTFSMFDGKGKKSAIRKFLPILLGVALLPTLFSIYMLAGETLKILIPINQSGVIVGLLLMGLAMTIFLFAIFLVPSVYYFSKDIETLLALPLNPQTIVASKFTVTVLYEYLTMAFISIPVLAAYIQHMNPSFIFYPIMVVVLLLLPIVPLIFASVLIMLVMWLIPFAKNRDFFNFLSGFFALAMALGINFLSTSSTQMSQNAMIELLMKGNDSLLNIFRIAIPNISFGIQALIKTDLVQLFIYIVIVIAIAAAFLLLASFIYFRGAIGVNETSANRRNLKSAAYKRSTVAGNVIITYALKELKLLIRTPIYFMNCVSTIVLMPVILLFSLKAGGSEFTTVIAMIPWNEPVITKYLLAGGFALGLAISSLNLITPTAISREGQNVYFMKYIPVSYFDQMQAKVISGMVISVLGIMFMLFPAAYIVKAPIVLVLMMFGTSLLSAIFMNYLGMIVDIIRREIGLGTRTIGRQTKPQRRFHNDTGFRFVIRNLLVDRKTTDSLLGCLCVYPDASYNRWPHHHDYQGRKRKIHAVIELIKSALFFLIISIDIDTQERIIHKCK